MNSRGAIATVLYEAHRFACFVNAPSELL